MEEKKNNPEVIDLRIIAKKIWAKKKLFYKVLPITFVLSCIYILGFPRYYSTDIKLAPEMGNSGTGSIGSIASAFGFDLSNMETTDAIYPTLYPDLMEDNGFVTGLFNIRVLSEDGEINTTYYDYLKKHQKQSIWSYPNNWVRSLFKSKKPKKSVSSEGKFDPYYLSEEEDNIAVAIRTNIMFSFNEKTGIVTISTKAQDPLICKTLADSVAVHLQEFITDYRTNKARIDYNYYKELAAKAKSDYDEVRQRYAKIADASANIALKSAQMKLEDMESDMELKFNAYSTINAQLEAAKAKVQERTPAFTILKGASVPRKPAGPKRMLFVIFMLTIATFATMTYILRRDILKIIELRDKKITR